MRQTKIVGVVGSAQTTRSDMVTRALITRNPSETQVTDLSVPFVDLLD